MKNPVCEELLIYQPTSTKDENLRLWYIGYSVFDAFLTITAIVFNSVTIQALRKTSSLPLPLKNITCESCCPWSCCWFTCPAFLHWPTHQVVTARQLSWCYMHHVFRDHNLFFCNVISRSRCSKRGQIFGFAPTSQIPGTSDSQASCCCGNLNMGVQCIFVVNFSMGFHKYLIFSICFPFWG